MARGSGLACPLLRASLPSLLLSQGLGLRWLEEQARRGTVAAPEEVRGPGQARSLGGRLPLLTGACVLGVVVVVVRGGQPQWEDHVPSLAPPPRAPQNGCGVSVGMWPTTGQVETPGSPSTRAGDLGEGQVVGGPFREVLPGSVSVFLPTPPSAPCPVQPPPSCIPPPMRGCRFTRTTCVGVQARACGH